MKKITIFRVLIVTLLIIFNVFIILINGHNVLHIHVMCDKLMFYDYITFNGDKYYIAEKQSMMAMNMEDTVDIEMVCNDGHILNNENNKAWYYREDTDYTFLYFDSCIWTKDMELQ